MSNALNNAAKLSNQVFLLEPRFGYVAGNGVNNTAALQAAIDAAAAVTGTLILPEAPSGEYIEHTGLTISAPVTIVGAGKFRSRLRLLGSATGAHGITFSANVDIADVHLQDIGLYGRYPSITSGHAIYLPDEVTLAYGRGMKLTRVYATDWGGKGLYVGENRNNGKAYDFEATRCEDAVYIDNSSDWKFTAGEFGVTRQFCVNIPGQGADNKFTDCSMWESQEAAVNLGTTGSSPNTFTGCTFDHHQKNAVRVSGLASAGQPHAFIGCWFRENSEAGDGLHAQILLTDTAGAVFIGNRFTDQEGNPRPSYVVEFVGTCGAVTWAENYVETDAYATALTNDAAKLVSRSVGLVATGVTYLGGESGAQGLRVNAGTAGGNYVLINPRTAGNPAEVSAQGADTNINLRLYSKGGGTVDTFSNGLRVHRSVGVASAVNYVDIINSATGDAVVVTAGGTDTDVDLLLSGKGAGLVSFGDRTASSDAAVTGYIEIKDSGGTVRRLALIG